MRGYGESLPTRCAGRPAGRINVRRLLKNQYFAIMVLTDASRKRPFGGSRSVTTLASGIIRWFSRLKKRPIDALQVEITTHCVLRCTFCPHETLRSQWAPRHMPLSLFERLAPGLHHVRFVHLQGWGEPLLNPDIFRMIEIAKRVRCEVGLTTSGVLLGKGKGEKLVEAGLDLIAVSIAGATAATHASHRVGSELTAILDNVRAMVNHRERLGLERPRVVVLFLMMRSNVHELPVAVDLVRDAGAYKLVATNLDYIGCEAQDVARAFSVTKTDPSWAGIVQETRERAARVGLEFRAYPLEAQQDVLVCEPVATSTAVVAVDGGLFPCVYLSVPVDPIPRLFDGVRFDIPRRPFGNVSESDLMDIWNGEGYQSFRGSFQLRKNRNTRQMLDALLAEQGAARVSEKPETLFEQLQMEAPLPGVCESCHKAYGL